MDLWQELIDKEENSYLKELYIKRRQLGIERYGTPLQPFNNRDCILDLQEEILDAIVYAEQVKVEHNFPQLMGSFQTHFVDMLLVLQKMQETPKSYTIWAYKKGTETYFDLANILAFFGHKHSELACECILSDKCFNCTLESKCKTMKINGRPVVNYFVAMDYGRFLPMEENKKFMNFLINPVYN
jgi:hypothetical protein